MARPREFDPDAVLERATRVFWARGFEHSSLDELCAATDLNRSSLYAAFGDKRALYLKSLARYEQGSVERIRKAFEGRPVREGLHGFLASLVDAIVEGPGRRGCFIGNCAAEMARLDRTAAARVKQSLERIEETFRAAFEAGGLAGARARARFITAGVQGLRLYGKANPDRQALEDVAATLMRCLD
jgi:TetR/AcrR family transcriptional repressor of nem operon